MNAATLVRDAVADSHEDVLRRAAVDPSFMASAVDAPALIHRVGLRVARALIEAGADVNRVAEDTGLTLLNTAVLSRDEAMVRFLLSQPGVDVNLSPPPSLNPPLANAVRQQAYAIAEALLDAGATCGIRVVFPGEHSRLLLQDVAMPLALFERMLPLADMPARRDAYLSAMSAHMHTESVFEKMLTIIGRAGAPVNLMSALTVTLTAPVRLTDGISLVRLLRTYVRAGGDPCVADSMGRSLFAMVLLGHRMLSEHAHLLETTFDVNYVRPMAIDDEDVSMAPLVQMDRMRECVLMRADMLERAWAELEPFACPLAVDAHPDAITRFTGLRADAYLALAAGQSRAAIQSARGTTLRMLLRWHLKHGHLEETRVRFWGMVWAFAVIGRPVAMLRHRLRVVAAGARRLRALRDASLQPEVSDHVTSMAVECDDAMRVRLFSGSRVWDLDQSPPPRFCVDVVNFAQHMAVGHRRSLMATRPSEVEGVTLNGIVYDGVMVTAIANAYQAYKRVDPSREAWLVAPDAADWIGLRASTFTQRYHDLQAPQADA